MARSEIRTWLPLDEFSTILGVSPLSFNQLHSNTLQHNTVCGEIFYQQSWLHADRVGRDDIAQAIQEAEQEISREVGYYLMPDWTLDERLPYPRSMLPEGYGGGLNVRAMSKSVEAPRGHVISGGYRKKVLIKAGATITRADVDTDGYAETCTTIVPVAITDANEIHLYYPGKSGDDAWEIRPIKVAISGGQATIKFKAWQIAAANQMDSLEANVLDADLAASYETTVDAYYVYNDPSTQVSFMWENEGIDCCGSCQACQFGTQTGCFHLRDPRMGFMVPTPAVWNTSTENFDSAMWAACREPDQVRVWYYSGYVDKNLPRPYAELSPYWKSAIAYFAASKFDRPVCGCSNVSQFIDKWRRDAAFASEDAGSFNLTAEQGSNRLGTSAGALYAWRRINGNGMRVNK